MYYHHIARGVERKWTRRQAISVELRITAAFIIGMIIGAVALTCFAIIMAEDKIRKGEKPKEKKDD